MPNGIIIRLAGVQQPITKIFQQEVISIGTAPDCDLVISAEGFSLPPESALLTLRLRDGIYRKLYELQFAEDLEGSEQSVAGAK